VRGLSGFAGTALAGTGDGEVAQVEMEARTLVKRRLESRQDVGVGFDDRTTVLADEVLMA